MLAFVNGWSCERTSDVVVCSCDHRARRIVIHDGLRPVATYAPPPGCSITVAGAVPVAAREQMSIVRDLLATSDDVPAPSLRVATSKDLTGSLWTRTITSDDGLELELAVVALTDGTYDYFARAIAPRSEHGAFYELLDSIEPLPAAH